MRAPTGDRGDASRQKLLLAAINVFGRKGFDGTSTRSLARAGRVNLQAIPYYFGSKEGLYIAAAEHIAASIADHVERACNNARAQLAEADARGVAVEVEEARRLLSEIMAAMATLFVSEESESWARFLIREQMEPTQAFRRVYNGVMEPTIDLARQLAGIILKERADSEPLRLRTLALLGGIMIFRIPHAAASAQLGWTQMGAEEVRKIQELARELVGSLSPTGGVS